MDKVFNYAGLFEQALGRIKSIRDPHATRPETADLRWRDVASQVIFDFVGSDLRKYHNVSQSANSISISCLCFMIVQLLKGYDYPVQEISVKDADGLAKAQLYILDKKSDTLLLFKELEECALWKSNKNEPKEVQEIMDSCRAKSCKYIYLIYDYAYLQIIGHNDDQDDAGRGYNAYSIKWFFESYFGTDEYKHFEKALKTYIQDVRNCIGYITIKTLTPGSLINFRKVTENEILKYPYEKLINIQIKNYSLESDEMKKLKEQFFNSNTFLGLLGSNDYAESLGTAEWLFDSMKKAQTIDLTIIGMGYFKAIEQLLFELLCLHKNEGRQIKKDYSRRELSATVELNDANIEEEAIDTTIGSMAVFYRDNLDMFRGDLTWRTRKYILETIFEYKDLRNGYFHKDNIHDWNKIESIRSSTFELLFLLLGAKIVTENDRTVLGFPVEIQSDYFKVCEYVHYHHGELFYLDLGRENEELVLGYYDDHSKVINEKYAGYTGVYFKELGKDGRIVRFPKDGMPSRISLGKFVFGYSDKLDITPMKVKTIFENGKFIGPSIAEEEKLDY
jgi:hypothetical protein